MPDREQVIKGLAAIEGEAYDRWVHRQYIEDPLITLIRDNIPDALSLLREQEPVKPLGHESMWFCGSCRYAIPRTVSFCPKCGRKVKWDE